MCHCKTLKQENHWNTVQVPDKVCGGIQHFSTLIMEALVAKIPFFISKRYKILPNLLKSFRKNHPQISIYDVITGTV